MALRTWADLKFFKPEEFDQPGLPGSGLKNMSFGFVEKLELMRTICGFPLVINSGYRTVEHEKEILAAKPGLSVPSMQGPNPFSAHTGGHGADIRATTARDRFKIISAAVLVGFNRIGGDEYHIHVDDDPRLPSFVFWFE